MLPNGICFHIPLKATMTAGGRATDLSTVRKVRRLLQEGAFAYVPHEAAADDALLREFADGELSNAAVERKPKVAAKAKTGANAKTSNNSNNSSSSSTGSSPTAIATATTTAATAANVESDAPVATKKGQTMCLERTCMRADVF